MKEDPDMMVEPEHGATKSVSDHKERLRILPQELDWTPDGWCGWHVHIVAGQYDSRTVVAGIVPDRGPFAGMNLPFAWRIPPSHLDESLNALMSDIHDRDDLPDQLREMRALPSRATVPQELIERLNKALKTSSVTSNDQAPMGS